MYVYFSSMKKRRNWVFITLLNTWLASPTQGKSTGGTELP